MAAGLLIINATCKTIDSPTQVLPIKYIQPPQKAKLGKNKISQNIKSISFKSIII